LHIFTLVIEEMTYNRRYDIMFESFDLIARRPLLIIVFTDKTCLSVKFFRKIIFVMSAIFFFKNADCSFFILVEDR